MHRVATSADELTAIYPTYKWRGPEQLIVEYLKEIGLPEPAEFFGTGIWESFRFAVEYRNVLVHECTYLGSDRSLGLIASCEHVLHKLAAAGGLEVIDA
jgi:hypothetical protein